MKKPKVFNLGEVWADVSWLQARRLLLAAQAGDKEAAEKLERMQNTKLSKFVVEPKTGGEE